MPLPSVPDYSVSIKTPALVHPKVLQGGHPIEKGNSVVKYAGGFCVVFPYQTPNKKYAVRCWHAEVSDAKERTQLISQALKASGLPYFVGFDYYEDGVMTPQGMQPVVVMDWVEAASLKKFIANHLSEPIIIDAIAENFKKMVADLHRHHFSHGDLQHGNIMVKPDLNIVLVDYDSMYVPALKGKNDEIKGLAGYQHLSRWHNKEISEKADYFSELVIYLSLKALSKMPSLWHELKMEDTETMLFSGEDIQSGGKSGIFQKLRSDSDLSQLVDRLCEFMSMSSIEDLSPLENVTTSLVDSIAEKWKNGNGFTPGNSSGYIDDPQKIISAWSGGNGYDKDEYEAKCRTEMLKNISEKFNKS